MGQDGSYPKILDNYGWRWHGGTIKEILIDVEGEIGDVPRQ